MRHLGLTLLRAAAIISWLASCWLTVTIFAFATQAAFSFTREPFVAQVFFLTPLLTALIAAVQITTKRKSPWIEITALAGFAFQVVCIAVPLI